MVSYQNTIHCCAPISFINFAILMSLKIKISEKNLKPIWSEIWEGYVPKFFPPNILILRGQNLDKVMNEIATQGQISIWDRTASDQKVEENRPTFLLCSWACAHPLGLCVCVFVCLCVCVQGEGSTWKHCWGATWDTQWQSIKERNILDRRHQGGWSSNLWKVSFSRTSNVT